jgi:hypothetical protein
VTFGGVAIALVRELLLAAARALRIPILNCEGTLNSITSKIYSR